MGRLIYADDVKDLINGLDSLPWEDQVDEMVDAIPTAYDVDNVVEELEEEADTDQYGKLIGLDDAINIVKRGGRDE